jgi:predicted ATPase/class 3 adenylate cyclase
MSTIVCPSCGEETPVGFPRCANCGAALAAEVAPAREERKVVTVLFADLVGFTSRAERLDPEEVRALQAPYWSRLRSELERYGGTVEKFIGDAVMALFGAPTAHEDDPERAVRAALAIRDWAQEEGELEVRIGITTGEALVSLNARPEAGEGMASGDVVNTASRLQAAAPVNGVLVDESTYRATVEFVDYEQAEAVEAKGKSQPVSAWAAAQARAVIAVELRPVKALVGRARERDLLVDTLGRVRRESSAQLVTIVGVPGIGKSRLVAELFAAVESDAELIFWRQGRSLPYGEGVSYWAFAEMVKAQAGILDTDAAEIAARKLHDAVASFVEAPDAAWVEARLAPLIGLGAGAHDRDESFAAWRRFVEALAERRPTVLVFEDLHWADDDLLDFVDHLLDWATGVPLLAVGTARPELFERRPGWGGGKRNSLTISLAPLDDVETAQLISALLERSVLPAETQAELLSRAGGNPLYAEQFARMLTERSDVDTLPETVQGIIAARLDALSAEEKALLQDASVLGKVFWLGALEAISGVARGDVEKRLHALERKEFVRRERRSTVAEETEHAFAHLLIRDVSYSQVPRAQRVEKHRLAAEWIESLARAEDHSELLAHHYQAAFELADAAGLDTSGMAERARIAFVEAGDRAASLNAFIAAARFYSSALDLIPEDAPERPYIVVRLEGAREYGDARGDVDALVHAIEALVSLGDREAAAEAEVAAFRALFDRGDRRASHEHLDRALALVADAPASKARALVLTERARSLMLASQARGGLAEAREALATAEELGDDTLRAELLNTIGLIRTNSGDAGGLEDLQQSLKIALEINVLHSAQRAYNNLCEFYRRAGDWPRASKLLAERREMAERFGLPLSVRWAQGEAAIDGYYVGKWDDAVSFATELISAAEASGGHYLEGISRVMRSKIRLARGDGDLAVEDSIRALAHARAIGDPQNVGAALAHRARMLLDEGNRGQAAQLADESLALPPNFYPLVDLALVLHEVGRGEELRAWLEGFPGRLWVAAVLAIVDSDFHAAAESLARMGNVAEAAYVRLRSGTEVDIRLALEFYRSVGATRYIREGESMLAASA